MLFGGRQQRDPNDAPLHSRVIFSKAIKGNKANLGDLIAATGIVILLELDSNRRFFSTCDLEIWWMTLKNNGALHQYYAKLCASFPTHPWIQTTITVWKYPNSGQNWRFVVPYASFSKPWVNSNCWNRVKIGDFFVPYDLEIWQMTLKNNKAPLLCCIKLCASFRCHWWIKTGVTVRKLPIWVKIDDFLGVWLWTLMDDLWKTLGHLS